MKRFTTFLVTLVALIGFAVPASAGVLDSPTSYVKTSATCMSAAVDQLKDRAVDIPGMYNEAFDGGVLGGLINGVVIGTLEETLGVVFDAASVVACVIPAEVRCNGCCAADGG